MQASLRPSSTTTHASSTPTMLKALLGFDAVTCLLLGAVLMAANAAAARITGLPAPLLMEADGVLLLFGAFVGWAALKRAASRVVVLCIVNANFSWAVASVAVAILFTDATSTGRTLVVVQGVAVGALAVFEFLAWKRAG